MGLWSLHTTRQQRKRLRPADAPPPPQPPRLVAWMLGRPYVPQAQRNAAAAAAASRRNPPMAEPPPAYVPDEGTPPAYAFVLDSYTAPIGRGTPAPYYSELFPMAGAGVPPPADAATAAGPAGTSVPMPLSPAPAVTVTPADMRRPTPGP